MTKIDDGGPAFPAPKHVAQPGGNVERVLPGMTLRDYFAGQALAGISGRRWSGTMEEEAAECYEIADAILLVRAKDSE